MLALYSVLKPPKSGNCIILNSNVPKITINGLKIVLNTNNPMEKKIKLIIYVQLDSFIIDNLKLDDVFETVDHNYFKVDVDATVYPNSKQEYD